jgi:hypothetical protein
MFKKCDTIPLVRPRLNVEPNVNEQSSLFELSFALGSAHENGSTFDLGLTSGYNTMVKSNSDRFAEVCLRA